MSHTANGAEDVQTSVWQGGPAIAEVGLRGQKLSGACGGNESAKLLIQGPRLEADLQDVSCKTCPSLQAMQPWQLMILLGIFLIPQANGYVLGAMLKWQASRL